MAAFQQHPPLVTFLQDLDTNTGVGATKEFLSALGRKLVVAQLIPEEEFAKTGAPSAADLGSISRGDNRPMRGVFCLLRFTSVYGVNNVYRENY